MHRLVGLAALTASLLASGAALSQSSGARIIEAKDFAELQVKWCAADPALDHILVLPASLFVDSQQVICDGGPYKLYRLIEHDDPDDYEYFLDPPFGSATRLGCDGKAGRGMQVVALNCRPLKVD